MLHKGYKVWYTYKGVLCQYLDGVNYDFESINTLHITMDRCRKKHPEASVWYEVVNVRPYNAPSGKVYRKCRCSCDVRIIYKYPEKSMPVKIDKTVKPVVTLTVRTDDAGVIRMGKYFIKKSADDKYVVEGSEFVGTLDECTQYVEYVRKAPECYKTRAQKCHNMNELIFRTDIKGYCNTTFHTAQKMPKKPMDFHRRLGGGNRYAY